MSRLKNNKFWAIGLILFVASLPCESFSTVTASINGIQCLLFGWLSVLVGFGFAWLANPFLILAWILQSTTTRSGQIWASGCTGLAIILMLIFLITTSVPIDEGGTPQQVLHIGIGYWLWVLSGVFTLMGIIVKLKNISSLIEWTDEDYKHLTSVLAKRATRNE